MTDTSPADRLDTAATGRRSVLAAFAGAAAMGVPGIASAQDAKEAPALAKLVSDGKLPKLADRLPAKPLVVTPIETSGTYGGQLRRGLRGSADHNGILRMVGNQGLVRWNMEFTEVLPNVVESWEVNEASPSSPSSCARACAGRTGIRSPPMTSCFPSRIAARIRSSTAPCPPRW